VAACKKEFTASPIMLGDTGNAMLSKTCIASPKSSQRSLVISLVIVLYGSCSFAANVTLQFFVLLQCTVYVQVTSRS